jgi:hypothetical protein
MPPRPVWQGRQPRAPRMRSQPRRGPAPPRVRRGAPARCPLSGAQVLEPRARRGARSGAAGRRVLLGRPVRLEPPVAWHLERFGFDIYDHAAARRTAGGRDADRGRRAGRAPGIGGGRSRTAHLRSRRRREHASRDGIGGQRSAGGSRPVRPGDHPAMARAEQVMEPGPATVRAREPLDALLERMAARDVDEIVATMPEARLPGVVRRAWGKRRKSSAAGTRATVFDLPCESARKSSTAGPTRARI